MRPIAITALAVLLFLGGFAAVRAQSDDLRDELARLHAVAAELALRPEEAPRSNLPQLAPLQRISMASLVLPAPWREHPRAREEVGMVREVYLGPAPVESAAPIGTIEELAELLRDRLRIETEFNTSYEAIFFRGSAEQRARIDDFAERWLRPNARRSVLVETTWGELFEGRHLAAVGARSLFWVGRQRVVMADPDVESTGAAHGVTDPYIEAMHLGETLLVTNAVGPGGVHLDLNFESRRAAMPMRSIATRYSGRLDEPDYRETLVRPQVRLVPAQWTAVHRGAHTLRVRAHLLERGVR